MLAFQIGHNNLFNNIIGLYHGDRHQTFTYKEEKCFFLLTHGRVTLTPPLPPPTLLNPV